MRIQDEILIGRSSLILYISIFRIMDITSTYFALKLGGYELNPITRFFVNSFGLESLFTLIPIQISLSVLFISLIYFIIDKTDFSENERSKYFILYNVIILIIILSNISTFINNFLVIRGII